MPIVSSKNKKKVLIAGATGFIGRHLAKKLKEQYHLIGLTRISSSSQSLLIDGIHEWRQCDLLSLSDTEKALEGVDFAFYLVHSMMPSARLSQGHFWDFDLNAADNFGRAAQLNALKQIIYLGGIVPGREVLSSHLQSRYEVEQDLKNYKTPVTTLRAGLVIGADGSSFLTMTRIVKKLPFQLIPAWAKTLTHPIALDDTIELLCFCLSNTQTYGHTYEIGGPELMSYRTMQYEIALQLGKKIREIPFPRGNARLIQFFLTLLTQAPKELVLPLVESLQYPIVARERKLNKLANLPGTPFKVAVRIALDKIQASSSPSDDLPVAFQKHRIKSVQTWVRSIQRFPLPEGKTAEWMALNFFSWISSGLPFLFSVQNENNEIFKISLRFLKKYPLFVLHRSVQRSWPDRWLFSIIGGWLVAPSNRGRLEFREILERNYVLVGIHEYHPRLPWYVYLITQAPIHLWVMKLFNRYIQAAFKQKQRN